MTGGESVRSVPMVMVRQVSAATNWYCWILEATSDHDGEEFNRIMAGDQPLLMLHHWTEGEHGLRAPPPTGRLGDGVALCFSVADLDQALVRAGAVQAEVVVLPWRNPRAGWREATLRDPDGYTVMLLEA